MKNVMDSMNAANWRFAPHDPAAVATITKRLRDAAVTETPIKYSDVVRGVSFRLPSVERGKPFEIDVQDWRDLDRAIVGDFLGFISVESYRRGRFMLSALAVAAEDGKPSRSFFDWARTVGLLNGKGDGPEMDFWIGQIRLAKAWAAKNA